MASPWRALSDATLTAGKLLLPYICLSFLGRDYAMAENGFDWELPAHTDESVSNISYEDISTVSFNLPESWGVDTALDLALTVKLGVSITIQDTGPGNEQGVDVKLQWSASDDPFSWQAFDSFTLVEARNNNGTELTVFVAPEGTLYSTTHFPVGALHVRIEQIATDTGVVVDWDRVLGAHAPDWIKVDEIGIT